MDKEFMQDLIGAIVVLAIIILALWWKGVI